MLSPESIQGITRYNLDDFVDGDSATAYSIPHHGRGIAIQCNRSLTASASRWMQPSNLPGKLRSQREPLLLAYSEESLMSVPVLEFFNADWIIVPAGTPAIQFRLIATPPVAANVGVVVFAKPTTPIPGQSIQWAQIGRTAVDNIPDTLPGPGFSLPVRRGMDYVIRFQGEGHLLMPGFQAVTVGFDLSHAGGPLSNFDGSQTANNARAAGINGNAYLRCA